MKIARHILVPLALLVAQGCATAPVSSPVYEVTITTPQQEVSPVPSVTEQLEGKVHDFCFTESSGLMLKMQRVTTTPEQFLKFPENSNVIAAINGMYFGPDNLPEGIAYVDNGGNPQHLATQIPRHTRGYFAVKKTDEISVGETLSGLYTDYRIVIGTHPLLVVEGIVHPQAREQRYRSGTEVIAFRSAIGTKDGTNICFGVSREPLLMETWAEELLQVGYRGAINLDGGPYSQLALRNENVIITDGPGERMARLIISAYKP